jgi:hypothetical protein
MFEHAAAAAAARKWWPHLHSDSGPGILVQRAIDFGVHTICLSVSFLSGGGTSTTTAREDNNDKAKCDTFRNYVSDTPLISTFFHNGWLAHIWCTRRIYVPENEFIKCFLFILSLILLYRIFFMEISIDFRYICVYKIRSIKFTAHPKASWRWGEKVPFCSIWYPNKRRLCWQ